MRDSRALVIGYGRMGGFHARVLRDLGYDVATVDPDPMRAAGFLRTPRRREFDVVAVAVPIERLAETAAEWAGFTGHLLVEKPFAATTWDARRLATVLAGQRVCVGYVERFNPQVRALKEFLAVVARPDAARFVRWSSRPSPDHLIDLRSHDVDLAHWLGLDCPVTYDTGALSKPMKRTITVSGHHWAHRVDLTAHDTSPLHAMWHAFLTGTPGYATPADAVRVLEALDLETTAVAA